jgi:Na+-driven multidrug efflux pump
MKLVIIYSLIGYIVIGIIFYFARFPIAKIFSDKDDLVNLVSENMIYMILVFFIHGMSMALGGGIRGLGK